MSKRAIRRHHERRIRRRVERWVRRQSRPDSWQDKWEWKYDGSGNLLSRRNVLLPDWRERYGEHVRVRVYREASHRPHFCQMCRRPRYRDVDRRSEDWRDWLADRPTHGGS